MAPGRRNSAVPTFDWYSVREHPSILLFTEWLNPDIQRGIARFAKEANWRLSLEMVYERSWPWGWRGDGCICMVDTEEAADLVASLQVPTVDLSHQEAQFDVARIHEDDEVIGRMAAEHLLDLGLKRFASYSTDRKPVADDRCAGFRQTVEAAGGQYSSIYCGASRMGKKRQWAELRRQIAQRLKELDKPAGVFCVDDRLAVSIVEVAMDLGIQIPSQLAVMGVGNLEIACVCSAVPITSVAIDYDSFGYEAAAMLDSLLTWNAVDHVKRLVAPEGVVVRKSTQTLAIENPLGAEVIQFMLDHYRENIGIDDIVRATDVANRRQLNYIFARERDEGPASVLEQIRMREAQRLLIETDRSVKWIAAESGFQTALRLQRVFRRRHGMSPGQYRKRA